MQAKPQIQAAQFRNQMLVDSHEFSISDALALAMQPSPGMQGDRIDEVFKEQAHGRDQPVGALDSGGCGAVPHSDARMKEAEPTRRVSSGLGPPKRYFRRVWIGILRRVMRLHGGVKGPRAATCAAGP